MNSNEKLHCNNAENDRGLSVVQKKGLPEESKIGVDPKLNLMNREKQDVCSSA